MPTPRRCARPRRDRRARAAARARRRASPRLPSTSAALRARPAALGATHRAAAEARAERRLVHLEQTLRARAAAPTAPAPAHAPRGPCGSTGTRPGRRRSRRSTRRILGRSIGVDVAAMLDRQVGDAAARVEHRRARRRRCVGHASRHAVHVPQWSVGRRVGDERGRGQHVPMKKQEPTARREQVRVLADPAQPGARGQVALEHRARVHGRAAGDVRAARLAQEVADERPGADASRRGSRGRARSAPRPASSDPSSRGPYAERQRHHRAAARAAAAPGRSDPRACARDSPSSPA